MNSIRIFYDEEGDILDIIFSSGESENRTGFELNENIVIFTDKEISRALGMMFISYSRLLTLDRVKLDFLNNFPVKEQKRLLKLISSEPVKHFLRLITPPKVKGPLPTRTDETVDTLYEKILKFKSKSGDS